MKKTTRSESKPRPTTCPEEVTYLELLRTTDRLSRRLTQVLKTEDLSSNQYNVLVIKRWPISPQGSPSGAPRRIRRTLYWLDERSSVFSTCVKRRDSLSVVRSSSRYVTSSGQVVGRGLLSDRVVFFI